MYDGLPERRALDLGRAPEFSQDQPLNLLHFQSHRRS